jgi:chemotaxis protein MotA
MEVGTIVGFIYMLFACYWGMRHGLDAMYSEEGIILVVGGSVAWGLVAYPLEAMVSLAAMYKKTVLNPQPSPTELIEKIVGFAETARREGILALEHALGDQDDPFLAQGVRLAVDGTEPDLIVDILETEIQFTEERHKLGHDMYYTIGETAPSMGMIGTLIGLILMLRNLNDPAQIGPGMSLALTTTLYGAFMANIVYKPFGEKLKAFTAQELLYKRMILEGIMAIQSGDNPRIVEHKLMVFLPPRVRFSSASEEGKQGG